MIIKLSLKYLKNAGECIYINLQGVFLWFFSSDTMLVFQPVSQYLFLIVEFAANFFFKSLKQFFSCLDFWCSIVI